MKRRQLFLCVISLIVFKTINSARGAGNDTSFAQDAGSIVTSSRSSDANQQFGGQSESLKGSTSQDTTVGRTTTMATIQAKPDKPKTKHYTECNATHEIALQDINLEFIWMEPKSVYFEKSLEFLNTRRNLRLRKLRKEIHSGFKTSRLQMVRVKFDESKDFGCLRRFSKVKSFAKRLVKKGLPIDTMFLAAALTERYFKRLSAKRFGVGPNDKQPFLRVTALFAEDFSGPTRLLREPQSYSFKGDGNDTCNSNYPSPAQLKNVFDRGIDLLLVSPAPSIRNYWGKVFGQENCVSVEMPKLSDQHIYPWLTSSFIELLYDWQLKPYDYLALFMKKRVTDFACRRFPHYVRRRDEAQLKPV